MSSSFLKRNPTMNLTHLHSTIQQYTCITTTIIFKRLLLYTKITYSRGIQCCMNILLSRMHTSKDKYLIQNMYTTNREIFYFAYAAQHLVLTKYQRQNIKQRYTLFVIHSIIRHNKMLNCINMLFHRSNAHVQPAIEFCPKKTKVKKTNKGYSITVCSIHAHRQRV